LTRGRSVGLQHQPHRDDLFDGAIDQPKDQRSSWLRARCDDVDVRAEVEALLDAHDLSGGILDRNVLEVAAPFLDPPRADRHS